MKHFKQDLAEVERLRRRATRASEAIFRPTSNFFGDGRAHGRGDNRADDAGAVQPIAPTPRASRRRQAWAGNSDAPASLWPTTEIAVWEARDRAGREIAGRAEPEAGEVRS